MLLRPRKKLVKDGYTSDKRHRKDLYPESRTLINAYTLFRNIFNDVHQNNGKEEAQN
jgi:hypothetical protein